MELDRSFSIVPISFALMGLLSSALAAASFISDSALDVHPWTARTFLKANKGCPVNFESLDYTVITSKCKGPNYPANRCCKAFKEFACPYADELNNLSNNCASIMFYYINKYGKFPHGLFFSKCVEGKKGLKCPSDNHHNTP